MNLDTENFPELRAEPKLTGTCLTLVDGDSTLELFLDANGKVNLWELDDWVSKRIADVAEKQRIRKELLGQ